MSKLKIINNVYFVGVILFLVLSIVFMTPYYDLYLFGNASTSDVYNALQDFNKEIFIIGIILGVMLLIGRGFDIGTKIYGVIGMGATIIIFVASALLLIPKVIEILDIKELYVNTDFSQMMQPHDFTVAMINAMLITMLVLLTMSLLNAVFSVIELRRKERV